MILLQPPSLLNWSNEKKNGNYNCTAGAANFPEAQQSSFGFGTNVIIMGHVIGPRGTLT